MTRGKRVVERHQAATDLSERWPSWTVYEVEDLPPGVTERWLTPSETVLVNSVGCGREWALAHVTAHLDLSHHVQAREGFTQAQEDDATWLAEMRLDYDVTEFPLDGEPSLGR